MVKIRYFMKLLSKIGISRVHCPSCGNKSISPEGYYRGHCRSCGIKINFPDGNLGIVWKAHKYREHGD